MKVAFSSTKTWGHEQGLSCAFRQWRAESHCRHLHGYALSVSIEFGATALDANGWVIDFGGLKEVKARLVDMFDHRTLVAQDDPHLEWFQQGRARGLLSLLIVPAVGCEAFANLVHAEATMWLGATGHTPRVHVASVEVREHAGNSAIVRGEPWPLPS